MWELGDLVAENLVAEQKFQTMLVTLDYEARAMKLVVVVVAQAADAVAAVPALAMMLELVEPLKQADY